MAASRALRRLLAVLELEEEQAQGALESALAALRSLEEARAQAGERERRGRRLVAASAHSGEMVDRLAGLEQAAAAQRLAGVLRMRIREAESAVAARRECLLAKRAERRQAATLVEEAKAAELLRAARREQQAADECFLGRRRERTGAAAERGTGKNG